MVVKCIKEAIEPKPVNKIINSNMKGYLEPGTIYKVYGIRCTSDVIYYMIFDERHLLEVPAELFEIVDNKASSLWEVQKIDGEITFWPHLFYNEDFFENFSEWNDKERSEFDKIKDSF